MIDNDDPDYDPNKVPTGFALIIVTNGGDVKYSRGYPTRKAAEDGKSMALHGRTVSQMRQYREDQERFAEQQAKTWRDAHPPRVATPDEIAMWSRPSGVTHWSSAPYSTIEDGMIFDWPGSGLIYCSTTSGGGWNMPDNSQAKVVEIIEDEGGQT